MREYALADWLIKTLGIYGRFNILLMLKIRAKSQWNEKLDDCVRISNVINFSRGFPTALMPPNAVVERTTGRKGRLLALIRK